jgi:hypothetical protein
MLNRIHIEIRYFFKEIYRGLYNLYDWFSIVWKDRDWDYQYFFFILRKKLQRYEKEHYNSVFESREQTLKYVRICIKLVDELIEDPHVDSEQFNIKHPSELIFIPYVGENDTHKGCSTLEKKYLNPEDESRKTELDELFSESIKKDAKRRNKVKTLLFKILSTQIEFWWT